jgi:proteasome component ECM29
LLCAEVIQGVAGKGLTYVYQVGDAKMKELLVKDLAGTLSSGKKGFKLSGDTQLFEDNLLGSTPSGETLSTYSDLCSLATELGKPDLVYQVRSPNTKHN